MKKEKKSREEKKELKQLKDKTRLKKGKDVSHSPVVTLKTAQYHRTFTYNDYAVQHAVTL